ncbi:MAG: protein kinase [Myxococcota bacterium]|nr:protein kinase [Myxococcota bacterium]
MGGKDDPTQRLKPVLDPDALLEAAGLPRPPSASGVRPPSSPARPTVGPPRAARPAPPPPKPEPPKKPSAAPSSRDTSSASPRSPEPRLRDDGTIPTPLTKDPTADAQEARATPRAAPAQGPGSLTVSRPSPIPTDAIPRGGADLLPVIGTFGPYDILGRLAVGGMAEVLLARPHGGTGRPIVVKKILAHFADDDDFRAMFEDEAKLGLLLDHPHIARCTDHGSVGGQAYLEMEWIDGVPLGRLIRRARDLGGVSDRVAVTIAAQVADALDHAHRLCDETGRALQLVHRDVSPHNVMISYDGDVKLLDFGIAKAEARQHETRAGVVKGKFAYMAPEQVRGEKIDARADVFALGVVLFEALIGKSLYRRETDAETMTDILDAPVPSLAAYRANPSSELEAVLRKSLVKEPTSRFSSAAALRDALLTWLRGHGGVARREEIAELVGRCFAAEAERGPRVDTMPFGQSVVLGAPPRTSEPSGTRELELELGEMDLPPLDLDRKTGRPPAKAARPSDPFGGLDLPDLPLPEVAPPASRSPLAPKVGSSPVTPLAKGAPEPSARAPLAASARAPLAASARAPLAGASSNRAAPARTSSRGSTEGRGRALVALAAVVVVALAAVGVFVWKPWAEASDAPSTASRDRVTPLPSTGSAILVASTPPGANVELDGAPRGVTPLELNGLVPGTYVVRVSAEGHAPFEQSVTLTERATETVMARLERSTTIDLANADGLLTFETRPPAEVFVGGTTSLGRTPLRRTRVPSGALDVVLVDAEGTRRRTRLSILRGEETRVFLELSELDRQ